jgi:hypothetical protein
MISLAYIGPGLGIGTIILIFVIVGIVALSFGYIIYLQFRKFFSKGKKK